MWGNCSNGLCYRLETCNSFLKKSPAQVFSCEFSKIFRNPFLTEHLQTTAYGFFCSFYSFLLPVKLIETSFFLFLDIFIPAFERDENDLVVAAWEHTFLGDITWSLAMFCRLINISICTYWISVLQLDQSSVVT